MSKNESNMRYAFACLLLTIATVTRADQPVQFARDVLPILSANCFACHGPDEHERQADLRLDLEVDAKALRDGKAAIMPGSIEQSSIVDRMTSDDPDLVMPPPTANRQLEPAEIDIIRGWISKGAPWQRHWSFEPIKRPEGSIDQLVDRQLQSIGLTKKHPAAPEALVRRLSLDLIGLPPTPETADVFASDPSRDAYERLVDELLESPQFGEHWARMWLDLARYADTKGYEKDLGRTMWPYRDWVVDAFNADMPLERFTREQLAGDLIPGATPSQIVATAFHRNTMSNDEGGTDDEEFRSLAVKDRIDTTVQVWMGLTMGCAKCHTHKYDPISQAAYYQFYALFNQTEDADRHDDEPRHRVMDDAQVAEQKRLSQVVDTIAAKVKATERELALKEDARWAVPRVLDAKAQGSAKLIAQQDGSILAEGAADPTDRYEVELSLKSGRHTAIRLDAILAALPDGKQGVGRNPNDPNFVVSEIEVAVLDGDEVTPVKLTTPRADYSQGGWPAENAIDGDTKTGWAVSPRQREPHVAMFDFAEAIDTERELKLRVTLTQNYGDRLVLAHFRLRTSDAEPKTLLPSPDSPEIRRLRDDLAKAEAKLKSFEGSLALVPVMRELPEGKRRMTAIHKRGNFLDPGDEVQPDVLTDFGDLPAGVPRNRLGVAQWLVNENNPLTARVWANRVWARLMGSGIVETEEDFGMLGSLPSNLELLDRLAADYRDGGWSIKKLIKAIVMSETYRQASHIDERDAKADPRNVHHSRGARYRLSAEAVRDQTLAVAGLLSLKQGGPPVMPPQPAGLWRSTYNGQNWVDAEGEDRYRRGLYTYLKRTTPYPSLTTFDAGSGEVCQIRRIPTNTPLQALVTLNDPVYIEAAAAFAKRMTSGDTDDLARTRKGLRLALVRPVIEADVQPLLRLLNDARAEFKANPAQADALIQASRGDAGKLEASEFAAWIVVANTILNLDEFLTRN
jgi:mono/diheme cytochrome c family protein